MDMERAFKILGIEPHVSPYDLPPIELKKIYRTLVKQNHPDRFSDACRQTAGENRMKEINRAYHVASGFISSITQEARDVRANEDMNDRPVTGGFSLIGLLFQEIASQIGKLFERKNSQKNTRSGINKKDVNTTCLKQKQEEQFGELFKDAIKRGGDPSVSCAGTKRSGSRKNKNFYQRPMRVRSSSQSGPVGSIAPVSRIRGIRR